MDEITLSLFSGVVGALFATFLQSHLSSAVMEATE